MRLPELSVRCGNLRKLRGEIRPRVKLGVREVAPDQAQGVVALQETHHRATGSETERAAEVSVLDQRQLGLLGAEGVVAVSDRDQRARGRVIHEICSHLPPGPTLDRMRAVIELQLRPSSVVTST